MNYPRFKTRTKTELDKRCWTVFAAWVDFDPLDCAQGGQFEALGDAGGGPVQKLINDESQQQYGTTFDVTDASEGEKSIRK